MDNQGKSVAGISSSCAGSSFSSNDPFGSVSQLESAVLHVLSDEGIVQNEGKNVGHKGVESEGVSITSPQRKSVQSNELTVSNEPGKEEKRLEKFYIRRNKQEMVKFEEQPVPKLDKDRELVEECDEFPRKDLHRKVLGAKVSKNDEDLLVMTEDEVRQPKRARWNFRPRKPIQIPKIPKPNEAVWSKDTGKGSSDPKEGKEIDDKDGEERDNNGKAKHKGKKKKSAHMPIMPNFSLTLTKDEIEADFIAMTGQKPPRKPKKRTKTAQRALDQQFPGMHLGVITKNDYIVPQNPEKGE